MRDEHHRFDVAAIRSRHSLADVVGQRITLKRAGRRLRGLCPVHNEKSPSFFVDEDTFHCFGCGAHGDVIDYLKLTEGMTFVEAATFLSDGRLPQVDPRERDRRREEETAERLANIADAQEIWARCRPADGTPAEVYLREVRGLRDLELPDTIGFTHTWAWKNRDEGKVGPDLPALICAIHNVEGTVTAIQRIFLASGGRQKANMKAPKRTLGAAHGGAFRIGPPRSQIVVVEGPEDGLTLKQDMPERSIWVACGTSLMPHIQFPDVVESVLIAGTNDDPGRAAVAASAEAYQRRELEVRGLYPDPAFKDWNDEHRGVRR